LRQQIKVLQDELGYDGPDKENRKIAQSAERIKNGQKQLPIISIKNWINYNALTHKLPISDHDEQCGVHA